jgi:hypothetical protein
MLSSCLQIWNYYLRGKYKTGPQIVKREVTSESIGICRWPNMIYI